MPELDLFNATMQENKRLQAKNDTLLLEVTRLNKQIDAQAAEVTDLQAELEKMTLSRDEFLGKSSDQATELRWLKDGIGVISRRRCRMRYHCNCWQTKEDLRNLLKGQ